MTATTPPQVEIRYVDTYAHRRVVDTLITHPDGRRHYAGHLPVEGWFCSCPRGKKCPELAAAQTLIPRIPVEA